MISLSLQKIPKKLRLDLFVQEKRKSLLGLSQMKSKNLKKSRKRKASVTPLW